MSTLTINLTNVQPLDSLLTDISALSYSGNANKYLRVNAGGTAFEFATVAGGGTWGSITGTLSDQTDLQSALDAKLSIASAASTYLTIANAASTYLPLSGGTLTGNLSLGAFALTVHNIKPDATDGLLIESNNGTDIGLLGSGNTANVTWYGSHNFDTATQDTIAAFTGAGKTLGSLALATYPSLTELSYVKGVTSAIQTQLNAKGTFTLPSLTSGSILFSNGTTIAEDNANLFWDDTNNRLGIGTTSPTRLVSLYATGNNSRLAFFNNSTGTTVTDGTFIGLDDGINFSLWQRETGYVRIGTNDIEQIRITSGGLVTFNGVTSSSPALKRSSTELQVRLADDSGFAPLQASQFFSNDGYLGYGKIVVSNGTSGSPTVLTSSDSGKHYVNTGASAETYINLPTAVAGLRFRFTTNTNQRIRVVAATGDIIRYSDSSASTSGGYAQSINAAAGISIEIEAVDSTYWQVVGVTLSGGTPFYTFA